MLRPLEQPDTRTISSSMPSASRMIHRSALGTCAFSHHHSFGLFTSPSPLCPPSLHPPSPSHLRFHGQQSRSALGRDLPLSESVPTFSPFSPFHHVATKAQDIDTTTAHHSLLTTESPTRIWPDVVDVNEGVREGSQQNKQFHVSRSQHRMH